MKKPQDGAVRKSFVLLVLVALTVSCIISIQPAGAAENVFVPNSWISRPPMLEGGTMGSVAVDGKIYAIGADGTTQQYDPATLNWTLKTPLPNPVGGGIAAYQNKIYVIGESYNEVYDVATDTWTNKTAMPTWRIGVQANVVNGKIYLIGGMIDNELGTLTNVNEAYDPVTDTWTTEEPAPTAVYVYASAVVDNKIYVLGGSSDPPNVVSNQVQIYDAATDSWSLGTPMPTPVRMASAGATTGTFAPKRIYVVGGMQNGDGLNLNQIYDPQTDTWITGALMPTARYGLSVAVVNDTLYAVGGVLLPPYAFPKEPLATNEMYLPVGYDGPLPPYWVTSPTVNVTPTPTTTPTLNPSPTSSPNPLQTATPTETPNQSPSPSVPEFPAGIILPSLLALLAAATVSFKVLKANKRS
jgi:N-acetylneuraminic acid mutarotase